MVWNGRATTNGTGWIRGGEKVGYARLEEADADGRRAIHFHAATPNYRPIDFGWEWTTTPETGANNLEFAAVSFSLKITGARKMQELFFGLGADQPAAAAIRAFQPSFADGSWHRVTIPIRAMKPTPAMTRGIGGFALSTFVWNASDFDVWVDHVSLDREVSLTGTDSTQRIQGSARAVRGHAIPGKLECAFYDQGGEGVAYHDTTPINTLSAVLNQQAIHQRPHATAYHWNFRRDEGVDISFVKDFADLNHTNPAAPPINQLYIGGTEDGEWCHYTVDVKKPGTYRIVAAYGNIAGMKPLRFSVDGKPAAECPCPVVTGGMHTWTREAVGRIEFPEAGPHLLTLHYERGYNLAYFEFETAE